MLERWRQAARRLKREVYALYFAVRDPRVPWYAKAVAACVVGYALSPIDLIPDFIPILGYLDDLVLIPLGVMAVRAMIPPAVLAECRERAAGLEGRPRHWIAATVIVLVWVALAIAGGYWLARVIRSAREPQQAIDLLRLEADEQLVTHAEHRRGVDAA